LQTNREPSGKGTRAKHLKSGASRSKCGKATVEPVLNRSGSEPSLEWILLWNANQLKIAQDGITTNRQGFPPYSYLIVPNPMSLQLSPIRRLSATFDPASAQIGFFNKTSARSSRAEITMPDVTAVPALMTSGSLVLIF